LYSSKNGTVWEQTIFLNSYSCILSFLGSARETQKFYVSCGITSSYSSEDGFIWKQLKGDIEGAFSISFNPTWGYVAGLSGNYSLSRDGVNFVNGGKVTDTETPLTEFVCSEEEECIFASNYDNGIFIN